MIKSIRRRWRAFTRQADHLRQSFESARWNVHRRTGDHLAGHNSITAVVSSALGNSVTRGAIRATGSRIRPARASRPAAALVEVPAFDLTATEPACTPRPAAVCHRRLRPAWLAFRGVIAELPSKGRASAGWLLLPADNDDRAVGVVAAVASDRPKQHVGETAASP